MYVFLAHLGLEWAFSLLVLALAVVVLLVVLIVVAGLAALLLLILNHSTAALDVNLLLAYAFALLACSGVGLLLGHALFALLFLSLGFGTSGCVECIQVNLAHDGDFVLKFRTHDGENLIFLALGLCLLGSGFCCFGLGILILLGLGFNLGLGCFLLLLLGSLDLLLGGLGCLDYLGSLNLLGCFDSLGSLLVFDLHSGSFFGLGGFLNGGLAYSVKVNLTQDFGLLLGNLGLDFFNFAFLCFFFAFLSFSLSVNGLESLLHVGAKLLDEHVVYLIVDACIHA